MADAKIKVGEVLNVDFESESYKSIQDKLKHLNVDNNIVGLVEVCKATQKNRSGKAASYQAKVIFITDGARKDALGKSRLVAPGFWIESFEPIESNTVLGFNAKEFVVVHSPKVNEDGSLTTIKSIVPALNVFDVDAKAIHADFTYKVDKLPNGIETAKQPIQGQKLFIFERKVKQMVEA